MEETVKVQAMLNEKGAKPTSFEGSSSIGQFILSGLKKNSMLIALIVVVVFFGFSTKGVILLPRNVSNLIFQNAYIAILAVGMLLCILTGGNIDLSVGSSVCLVGAIAGEMMIVRKMPVLPSILLCLVLGLVIGIWQGFWIAYVGIPPFIATLAGQLIFRGLSLIVLNGLTLAPFPVSFQRLFVDHIPDFFRTPLTAQRITFTILGIVAVAVVIFLTKAFRSKFSKIKKFGATVNAIIYYAIAAIIIAGIAVLTYWLANNKKLTSRFIVPDITATEVAQRVTFLILGIIAVAVVVFLTKKLRNKFSKIKMFGATVNAIIYYAITVVFIAGIAVLTYWLAINKKITDKFIVLDSKLHKIKMPNFGDPEVVQRFIFIAVGIIVIAVFLTVVLRRRFLSIKKGEAATTKPAVFYSVTVAITAVIAFVSFFMATNKGLTSLLEKPVVYQRITFITIGIIAMTIFLTVVLRRRFLKIKKGDSVTKPFFFYPVIGLIAAGIAFLIYFLATNKKLTKFFEASKAAPADKAQDLPLNITCIIFGLVAALLFLTIKILGRIRKIKKGYATGNAVVFYFFTIASAAIIVFFSYWLAKYKGIPTVMITLIVVVLIYSVLTSMTVPGRYLYALGGNPKAARMSGIDTKKVMFFAYANMSFLAGVAALVFAARLNSANPTAGQNFELDAIASCFIGGASAYGGIGTVGGVLIGAAFMGIMNNGMNFMGFLTSHQQVVKGMVLLLAVAFDVISKRKSR